MAELGLEVGPFGGSTVALHSCPALLGNKPPRAILKAVVDYLFGGGKLPGRERLFDDLLSLLACHSVGRTGDRLTPKEISALVAQRALADGSHHCSSAAGRDLLKRLQIADDKPFLLP